MMPAQRHVLTDSGENNCGWVIAVIYVATVHISCVGMFGSG